MLRVLIVEDEEPILNLMRRLVDRHPMLEVAGAFTSPQEALARFAELTPVAAFLDVEMPRMGGIELAEKLKEIDEELQIVFTTAYPNYAVDAFRVSAVDYLLKPVTSDALERVVARLAKNQAYRTVRGKSATLEVAPSVRCFGTFETRGTDGCLMSWPTRKTEELFAYMLAYPNRLIGKWQLADLLWPDLDEDRSLHNVHNTIYRLKKAFKGAGLSLDLTHTNEGYHFRVASSFSDLERLREFMGRNCEIDKQNIGEATGLFRMCRGALFGGKDYSWSAGLAAETALQQASLARMLTAYHRNCADVVAEKETLLLYLSDAPLDESMNAELLRLYAELGETGPFRTHYERYAKLLETELALVPSAELQELAGRMS